MRKLGTDSSFRLLSGCVRSGADGWNQVFGTGADVPLRGFQDGQHGRGAAEELQSTIMGRHVLVGAGTRAEEVAQFVIATTEPGGRPGALETPHRPVSAFDAPVVLF